MPLNRVFLFLRPQKWSRQETLLLKHYYRGQGIKVKFLTLKYIFAFAFDF